MIAIDALGYLLEASRIAGQIRGILLTDSLEMVNSYFVDDSLLSIKADQEIGSASMSQ